MIQSSHRIRRKEKVTLWHDELISLILDLHESMTVAMFDMIISSSSSNSFPSLSLLTQNHHKGGNNSVNSNNNDEVDNNDNIDPLVTYREPSISINDTHNTSATTITTTPSSHQFALLSEKWVNVSECLLRVHSHTVNATSWLLHDTISDDRNSNSYNINDKYLLSSSTTLLPPYLILQQYQQQQLLKFNNNNDDESNNIIDDKKTYASSLTHTLPPQQQITTPLSNSYQSSPTHSSPSKLSSHSYQSQLPLHRRHQVTRDKSSSSSLYVSGDESFDHTITPTHTSATHSAHTAANTDDSSDFWNVSIDSISGDNDGNCGGDNNDKSFDYTNNSKIFNNDKRYNS